MAITKNKILTRDNTLSLSAELAEYWDIDDYYDWNDWDYDYYDCNCSGCRPLGWGEYDYMESPKDNRIILGKSRGVWTRVNPLLSGKLINMDTVYSREIMRERKIDKILGLSLDNITMGDIFYEEFRNIQRQLDSRGRY